MGLDGPSRRIVVRPVELPKQPEPREEPQPERAPDPVPEREPVPA